MSMKKVLKTIKTQKPLVDACKVAPFKEEIKGDSKRPQEEQNECYQVQGRLQS
jgi:hypothetical protein